MDNNNNNKWMMCPHCGSVKVLAIIKEGCIAGVSEDGAVKILQKTNSPAVEVLKCAACNAEISQKDMVNGVTCKKCGRVVKPSELDSNGICEVCNAPEELRNATKEDLIRMLLNVRKQEGALSSGVRKTLDKAEAVEKKLEEKEEKPADADRETGTDGTAAQNNSNALVDSIMRATSAAVVQDIKAAVAQNGTGQQPERKQRRKKKKVQEEKEEKPVQDDNTSANEDNADADNGTGAGSMQDEMPVAENTDTGTLQETNAIDAMNAPFPDMPEDNAENSGNSSFNMFDDDELF